MEPMLRLVRAKGETRMRSAQSAAAAVLTFELSATQQFAVMAGSVENDFVTSLVGGLSCRRASGPGISSWR